MFRELMKRHDKINKGNNCHEQQGISDFLLNLLNSEISINCDSTQFYAKQTLL